MDWKEHLGWGSTIILVLTILLVLVEFFTDWVDFMDLYGPSKITIIVVIPSLLIAILFGLYASLLPDVDIGTSKAFAITYMILILIMFYFLVFTEYIFPVFVSLILMSFILGLKHRGVMHKWYTAFIIGCAFGFLFSSYLIGLYVTIGYLTHLGCDAI